MSDAPNKPDGPPKVRRAEAHENAVMSATLTDAFVGEEGLNWWLKQGAEKTRARRKFFDFAVRDGINAKRELWAADGEFTPLGAAIWLPAGAKAFDFGALRQLFLTPFFLSIAGGQGMTRAMAMGAQLEECHPHEPHAHLVFLGVITAAQGKGVGSAILKETLKNVDSQHLPAYLEATTERNVALYKRHGFETTKEFDVPNGGPHFWTMIRPAR